MLTSHFYNDWKLYNSWHGKSSSQYGCNMVYDRKLASKQEKCMQSLLSGHISRLVEKIIAVPLTDFCNFFLQLSLSERVTKSVTLYKWLSCINMEFKNHYKKLNDIRRSQTHNLLLIKHFKPFSLWKGQSNSYLNQNSKYFWPNVWKRINSCALAS